MLSDVRNYLNITWHDEEIDKKLISMIERGKAYLNARVGKSLDYESDGFSKTLLLNHIMYENSGCLDEFYKNYHSEILSLKISAEVEEYAASKE